jgi:F0F1-type ATP synthase assembly protein I
MAAADQGALEAVLAVVIASLFGYWVDGRLGTSPAFMLVGLVLGFAAFCLRLFRLRDLMAGPQDEGRKPPESK